MKKDYLKTLICNHGVADYATEIYSKYYATDSTSHDDELRDITYEIMNEISGYGYAYRHSSIAHPDHLYKILYALLNDKQLMIKFFSEPRILEYVMSLTEKSRFKVNNSNIEDVLDDERNGVPHTEYETAIDVVETLEELGVENLDEEQLEEYKENIDIIERYEK